MGPFSKLLTETLSSPPKENRVEQGKNTHGIKDWKGDLKPRITLYRGLGLPEKAI